MLHAGSVAKGTALRTIDDMDVAVYVSKSKAPQDEQRLIGWLAERLREVYAYTSMTPNQFQERTHCVRINYKGSGLSVDVVPVLYEGDSNDKGWLIDKDTGKRVLTSIPMHLEFIRARKKKQPDDFAQVVRLVKWWKQERKAEDDTFQFKSFMIELVVANLVDRGQNLGDYVDALEQVFVYIVKSDLKEVIYFTDYYAKDKLPRADTLPIKIYDPVNPENNVANNYSEADRIRIDNAANEALESLLYARRATTKGIAVECWQKVLGTTFGG